MNTQATTAKAESRRAAWRQVLMAAPLVLLLLVMLVYPVGLDQRAVERLVSRRLGIGEEERDLPARSIAGAADAGRPGAPRERARQKRGGGDRDRSHQREASS